MCCLCGGVRCFVCVVWDEGVYVVCVCVVCVCVCVCVAESGEGRVF